MSKRHALHGRDHGPNGMDPIPNLGSATLYYATLSASGVSGNHDDPDWDADEVVGWTSSSISTNGGSSYFEYVSDIGDGTNGMKILEDGLYQIMWSCYFAPRNTGTQNPDRLMPPHYGVSLVGATSGSGDFDSAPPFGLLFGQRTQFDTWSEERPFDYPTSVPGGNFLGGQFLWTQAGPFSTGSPFTFTLRVTAIDGAHDWRWYSPSLYFFRIGGLGY